MRLERNIRLLWLFTLCANAFFLVPVLLPYYRDVIGVGYREFLYGEAIFAAAVVLFDVPTGWLSDVWKRKYVLALGLTIDVVGWSGYLFASHLWHVVVIQIILGLGYGLLSGSHTALLYDSLSVVGQTERYRKLEGKRLAYSLYAVAAASIVGGFLYNISPYLPVALTLVMLTAGLCTVLMLDEPERHKKISGKHPVADMVQTTVYALHGHAEIAFLILFTAVMFSATKLIMWSQQPYFMALNIPSYLFGILMAVGWVLGGLSSQLGHRLDGKVNTCRALGLAWMAALGVCLVAASFVSLPTAALLMLGGSCLYGLTSPRVNEAINSMVGSERRATILSTQSLMTNLFAIVVSVATGWASGVGGVRWALFAVALWLCLGGISLMFWSIKRKKEA